MLPWNYSSHSNWIKRNGNTKSRQNSRSRNSARQGNLPNNKGQSSNSQPINKKRAEEIKKAIRENRIEFVDGGARIIDSRIENREIGIVTTPEKSNALEEGMVLKEESEAREVNIHFQKLTDFIQNERNASIFYKYLASIASKEENANILDELSEGSLNRFNSLNFIYEDNFGVKYDVKKSRINNTIKFKDGIAWAIAVENRGLVEMIDMYENINTEKYLRKINAIMYRKTCDISFLHLILSSTKGLFS